MKIYLILKENVITGYSYHKVEGLPEVEIANPSLIKLDVDTFENGAIVPHEKPLLQVHHERILELRQLLADSDYYCLKHADGALTDEEYAPIKAQRQAWRDEINELED